MAVGRIPRWRQRRVLRRWDEALAQARELPLPALRRMRRDAGDLRMRLDRVIRVIDGRLQLPAIGSKAMPKRAGTDWAHRPEPWCGPVRPIGITSVSSGAMLGQQVRLFHDCAESEIALRQVRNLREGDLAPFGVRMEVFGFDGSFLSLAIDLPEEAARRLRRHHVLRLDLQAEAERPLGALARLNLEHGPNTARMVRKLDLGDRTPSAEFDLAYADIDEKRIGKAWLDLILEEPEMNQIMLRDVTLSRRPRAEL
ncbi:hypothetical protein BCF33_2234 [Hasllibacter halocynthiae]|uniref:Uncharacterized protein n=1 Tax=Hasllibacter halocynthiae TaxID=595589 RepID=A0A2T0X340_9RHOB|nr:DUF6478 family protein [Hasllibacter halocynthiae]PRY93366.1 hypothetical protein BCF33_2234 [Hasllibacter halocynthiae]